jgi:hypothetical protein
MDENNFDKNVIQDLLETSERHFIANNKKKYPGRKLDFIPVRVIKESCVITFTLQIIIIIIIIVFTQGIYNYILI